MYFARKVLGLCLVMTLPVVTAAQPKENEESLADSPPLEQVTVIGTRAEIPLSEASANISVVGEEQLRLLGAVHIEQVLNQIPGTNYHRGNGQESLPAIRSAVLTGAGACGNVLVLEETIPVRSAGFCNVNELFDTHFEQASRIEVVRGAGTAFYGSNSLLGSINVHLSNHAENQLTLELGPYQYRRASASAAYGRNAESRGSIYLTLSDDDGFREDAGYQQQKFSWRQALTLQEWTVNLGATATFLDQQTAGFIVGDGAFLDEALSRQNLDPEAFRKSDSVRAWARFERNTGARTWSVTPYFRATEMDFLQHFLPGDPLEQNEQTGLGLQSSMVTQVSADFIWTVGFDAEVAEGELVQSQNSPTQGSAFLQETIPAGKHYDYAVDATQLAAFAHFDWSFAERWQMLAGARLESIDYDYDNRMLDGRTREDGTECGFGGCRYSRPADRSDDFTHLSPKLEIRYLPSEDWRWHFSIADSFRAPQATELYRLQREQTQAELDEVRATHVEAGFQWRTAARNLGISLFRIEQENEIIRDSDFFNIDGQEIESWGVEAQWRQQISLHWSASLAASYSEHDYASDQFVDGRNIRGNRVDTAPEWVANLNIDWQASEQLNLQTQIHYVDDYFLEPGNQFSYAGHTVVNMRGRYQLTDQLTATLRLLNVFDKRYAKRADYTSFTEQRYFPGEPRALFAALKWGF